MARLKHSYTTQQHQDAALFETDVKTPAIGSLESLPERELILSELERWEAVRDSGISPLNQSGLDDSEENRIDFLIGAHMLGLVGGSKHLTPQQYRVADVINSEVTSVAMLMSRRSTKTTGAFCVALGRARRREDYKVAYTVCITAKKAGERFYENIVTPLERMFKDPKTRPFQIMLGKGAEAIRFPNGSVFKLVAPDGENFRSDELDMIILDEAGEAGPEMSADLKQGVLATMDTRPGAQLIVAGTAAKFRDGNLLWEYLEDGRNPEKPRSGIIEYAAPDSTTDEELASWEPTEEHPEGHAKELVLAAHPGIGTLTTIDIIEERFDKMTAEAFAQEYLSIFGHAGSASSIFNLEGWRARVHTGKLPDPPSKFALVIAVHPNQISACVVAVWRVKELAHVLVLDYRPRVDWLAQRARGLSTKYRTGIVHDTNGAITVEVETLARMRSPKPKLLPQTFPNVKTAAALLVKEVDAGNVVQYDQEPMNEAIRLATKRSLGPIAWALGRKNAEDDIICAEAAALGLRVYDEMNTRAALKPNFAA